MTVDDIDLIEDLEEAKAILRHLITKKIPIPPVKEPNATEAFRIRLEVDSQKWVEYINKILLTEDPNSRGNWKVLFNIAEFEFEKRGYEKRAIDFALSQFSDFKPDNVRWDYNSTGFCWMSPK